MKSHVWEGTSFTSDVFNHLQHCYWNKRSEMSVVLFVNILFPQLISTICVFIFHIYLSVDLLNFKLWRGISTFIQSFLHSSILAALWPGQGHCGSRACPRHIEVFGRENTLHRMPVYQTAPCPHTHMLTLRGSSQSPPSVFLGGWMTPINPEKTFCCIEIVGVVRQECWTLHQLIIWFKKKTKI